MIPYLRCSFCKTFRGNRVKTFALILFAGVGWASILPAGAWERLPANGMIVEVDWQSPQALPRRFRNHCVLRADEGRSYCADHCGLNYQFYYCSHESFGCCRISFGYCDWRGQLRCHP